MRQIINIFKFDIRSGTKDFIILYIVLVPLLILYILSTFLPSIESSSVTIAAVTEGRHAVESELIEKLSEFADVKSYDSIEKVEKKLMGSGSTEGLYYDHVNKQYVAVMEHSEESSHLFSITSQIIRQHYYEKNYPNQPDINKFSARVPEELKDRPATSPVATMGGSMFLVFMVIINAFIIGLNVIQDKEYGTDKALYVTPMSKTDYYIGKSIYPMLIMLAYTVISLFFLKLTHVNILMTYLIVIISFSITLLMGLLIGALGSNENEAIGIGKMLSMFLVISLLGGALLPDKWQWIVWWSPFYWMYDVLNGIFTLDIGWTKFIWKSALVLGNTGIYFMLLRKRVAKGLS